jgi:hypothetical protein
MCMPDFDTPPALRLRQNIQRMDFTELSRETRGEQNTWLQLCDKVHFPSLVVISGPSFNKYGSSGFGHSMLQAAAAAGITVKRAEQHW